MEAILTWVRGHKVIVALGVAVLFFLLYFYPTMNSVRNEGIQRETSLSAQYQSNQNYLSAFISGFYEQVSVVQAETDALNQILFDAVRGRYDGEGGGFDVGSSFFTGVAEAYPEASTQQLLENWAKIQDYISSQRAGYRNKQDKLLDMLRAYDNFRKEGIIRHMIVGMYFPSDTLEARTNEETVTGDEARDKMYTLVLTSEATEAYESGEMAPLEVPTIDETPEPKKTKNK